MAEVRLRRSREQKVGVGVIGGFSEYFAGRGISQAHEVGFLQWLVRKSIMASDKEAQSVCRFKAI